MQRYATQKDLLVVAVACLLAGTVLGAITTGHPAEAANGDDMVLGTKNTAITVTRLNTRGGFRIDNFKGGNPALILNVKDGLAPPIETNSDQKVVNLNADYLDNYDSSSLKVLGGACSDSIEPQGMNFDCFDDITTPRSGLFLLTGSANVYNASSTSHDSVTCSFYISDDGGASYSQIDSSARDIDVAQEINGDEVVCATSAWIQKVGGSYRFDFRVEGVGAQTVVGPGVMTYVYLPGQ